MFKKILSLALIVMIVMSVAAVSATAAQVEIADEGAEADTAATSALDTSKCLNFDMSGTGWGDPGAIGFYVYKVGGDELIPWGSKKLFKSENNGDVWSYDPAANGMELESGTQYSIIFVNQNSSAQTYDLLFDTTCLGDTAYSTGNMIENPVDSNKSTLEAKWKNATNFGPQLAITSIGNVVGQTCPATTTPYEMFVKFLKETLTNARTYANKDDQALIDDTAKALGIGKADVEKAISEAGVTTEWSKDKSSLADESDASANQSGTSSSGSSGSSSSGSSSGSSGSTTKTTGSSSSSSKSGSASNTQTGQTEDMLLIMLAVMVVAAGVIFFARKRERA